MNIIESEQERFLNDQFKDMSNEELTEMVNVNVATHFTWNINLWEMEKYGFYYISDKIPEIPICLINRHGDITNAFTCEEF